MKVICAWCKKEMGDTPDQDGDSNFEITHGICRSCKDYFFGDQARTLDKFLNQLAAPVLMVNPQGEVVLANDQALQFLGKDLHTVSGFKGGDVMECVYAKLPEGCGNTKHCVACTIRQSVMETFETGKSLRQVPAFLNRLDRRSVHKIKFLISTERVDDIVLLRIDEVVQA
jgi:PAS domain-containing protein